MQRAELNKRNLRMEGKFGRITKIMLKPMQKKASLEIGTTIKGEEDNRQVSDLIEQLQEQGKEL